MKLRVGTRGSDLALAQTRWVVERLQRLHSHLAIETVIIQTHGDQHAGPIGDEHWPIGGFVGAIERELLEGRIDFAVHSYKDLPTRETPGLMIAAVPVREAPNDVLITAAPFAADDVRTRALRIGTSSARRAAQLQWVFGNVHVVPIRGNVPTRVAKVQTEGLDGVVLAVAGLNRLGLIPEHLTILPADQFVPAPGQGALAVQTSSDADPGMVAALDHQPTRLAVAAERSFLHALSAGCQTAAGALAVIRDSQILLHGQLFSPDGTRMVDGVECGDDPSSIGEALAARLARELAQNH